MTPQESICLKIQKAYGEKAIALTKKLKIFNSELEIQRNEAFIYIPLARKPSKDELEALKEKIPSAEVSSKIFSEKKKAPKTLVELLEEKLPPHLIASLPKAMDFVGDIAIIEIPPELNAHKKVIGEAILRAHKNVRTVLAKAGAVKGVYRLREFNVIAGEPKTETIHKEYGCQFYVDLSRVYFSPRLSYEHYRVATSAREGETIIDLFAGVGPFAILIAKMHKNVRVYAIDINPSAIEYLKTNIRLNRVEGKVYPLLGDARAVVEEKLKGVADRIIMNLPEKAMDFVDVACNALKQTGGTVHFYSFVNAEEPLERVKTKFEDAVEKCGRRVNKILFSRFVRETAPYEWQAVLDAEII
ncbi:MAG: class I SAM-dependent methyltransferase family protein [Candidatus Bathyarchaeia archaeon]